ncbi:MAG TPA: MFS transporter [Ramlibacter sp.]|uniref:MFS transporter n=1 Tax=Ramlibacter sp. TaxID=1917967 RepID=UPI002ED1ADCF
MRSRPSEIPAAATPLRLILLLTVAHTSFGGARLAISLQALHLQASPMLVGLLMSLIMLVPTFVAVHVGRWVDRAGYRRPTVIALAGIALGAAVAALLPSLPGLALTSLLVGTSFMQAHVAVNNAIGHIAGAAGRTRAFGLMAVGFSLSALAGPMIAGAAIDLVGYRWAFALLAVLPLAAGWLLRDAPAMPQPERPAQAGSQGVLDLLRLPPLRAVLLVSAMVSAGWDLFTFLVPLHGAQSGLSATAIGVVAGAFGVGSATVRVALPWIMRRVPEWRLIGAALVLSGLGYFLFPFCVTVGTMLPLALVLGLVLGCGQPVVMSLLHVTAPAERTGEAVGLRAAITSLGQTVLPLAFGAFGTALGMLPLFWAAAALLGCGGGFAATRRRLH